MSAAEILFTLTKQVLFGGLMVEEEVKCKVFCEHLITVCVFDNSYLVGRMMGGGFSFLRLI